MFIPKTKEVSHLSITGKMGLPNKKEKCSARLLQSLKNIRIYKYSSTLSQDTEVIDTLGGKKNFHISLNPHDYVSQERLKSLMRLYWSKFGFFLYGKSFPKKLDYQYTIAIEEGNTNHIHMILLDITTEEFRLLSGYMQQFFHIFFPRMTIYNKEIQEGELKNVLLYDIKQKETLFMTNKDFKR